MRIGLFTDTYPPYINGVSTSVCMLKHALEKKGHQVFVVTVNNNSLKYSFEDDNTVIRIPGIPVGIYDYRLTGVYPLRAINIVKKWKLDVIHSHTEFGIGTFARIIAKQLDIPLVHTYHTMYEDYVHYITHGYFNKSSKKIVEYLTLLLHEIIHCIQQEYIRNNSNFKKDILFSSEMFRFYSCNDIKLQPLFPDEINANLLSVLFINQLIKLLEKENLSRYCEKQLIYYLTLGLINNESINSQLKYLYKHLLNVDYEEKFDSFNQNEKIIYGVTKSDLTMEKIFESYRTQKLCLDIKMKGGKR